MASVVWFKWWWKEVGGYDRPDSVIIPCLLFFLSICPYQNSHATFSLKGCVNIYCGWTFSATDSQMSAPVRCATVRTIEQRNKQDMHLLRLGFP